MYSEPISNAKRVVVVAEVVVFTWYLQYVPGICRMVFVGAEVPGNQR